MCNNTREEMARAVLAWIATSPTGTSDPDYLIVGDLNAYSQEDPIDVLRSSGYVDLVVRYEGLFQSQDFIFDGQAGNLGHAFASPSMATQVLDTEEWPINSDEPKVLDYEDFFNQVGCYEADEFRSADHDPISVSLALGAASAVPVMDHRWLIFATALLLGLGGMLTRRSRRA